MFKIIEINIPERGRYDWGLKISTTSLYSLQNVGFLSLRRNNRGQEATPPIWIARIIPPRRSRSFKKRFEIRMNGEKNPRGDVNGSAHRHTNRKSWARSEEAAGIASNYLSIISILSRSASCAPTSYLASQEVLTDATKWQRTVKHR